MRFQFVGRGKFAKGGCLVKRLQAFSLMTTKKTLRLLSIALVITTSFTIFIQQGRAFAATGSGFPHVQGTQLIDGNGQPLILRGAMIESPFAYIKGWQRKKDPLTNLNTTTFTAMAQQWHMNALRMNISEWIYNLDPANYLAKLDTAVQQANAAGLYVILDFHDDRQSGAVAPYDDGMLHKVSLTWWKTMATHYLNYPMVLYDPINEPQYPSWPTWLHGNGGDTVGYADVITAIRSTGAQQIIIVEPGKAGGTTLLDKGWAAFDPVTLTDPNIMYSKHMYEGIISGNPTIWDQQWGALLNTHPIFYGEWALLPHSLHPTQCKGLTSANADSVLNSFLTYLGQRQASWTAWDFLPHNLIEDTTDFKPTSFATGAPWICGSPSAAQAGMGTVVQNYLSNVALTAPPTLSPTPTYSKAPSISITSPVDGSKVQTERNVTITASVTHDVGVTKVAFFVNGTLRCTDTTAPYTCRWHTPSRGNATYTIQVRAYDSAGNTDTSTISVKSSSN
jgi:aryl-phospho-beta-D-glucosidase BglC (GH1 family)